MRFSLKYKILALIMLLLLGAVLSYLFIAVRLFQSDKAAYIYDTNSTLAETLAAETTATFSHIIGLMQWITISSQEDNGLHKTKILDLFNSDENIVELSVYKMGPKDPDLTSVKDASIHFSKTDYLKPYGLDENYYADVRKEHPLSLELVKSLRIFFQNVTLSGKAPLFAVGLLIPASDENKSDQLAVGLIRLDPLLNILSRSKIYTSYIVDSFGNILAHPGSKETAAAPVLVNFEAIKEIISGASQKGALDVRTRDDKDGQELILAYAKLGIGNLVIVTEIKKSLAFVAAKRLVEKSSLFALLIISVSLIVSILFSKTLTKSLTKLTDATKRIAQGDFAIDIDIRSRDEVGVLASSVNTMANEIQQLIAATVEKAKLEQELQTAQMVQNSFLPNCTIKKGPITVSGQCLPASKCGGDWWGHHAFSDNRHLVCIADVMGHGVPAALVTAMAYSSFVIVCEQWTQGPHQEFSPAAFLKQLNMVLWQALHGSISMTFFAAHFDFDLGILTYSNAGHNFPIVISGADDSGAKPATLNITGDPAGFSEVNAFKEKTIELCPGQRLVFYSDGLIEGKNPEGEAWGRRNLLNTILASSEIEGAALKSTILENACTYFGPEPLEDDITVVVAEISKSWSHQTKVLKVI